MSGPAGAVALASKFATPALLAAAIAACGALPPQAPLSYAKKLDSATSGISTACGEAYRVTAFPGDHRHDLEALESTAATDVHKLAKVFKRNRDWVYQGFTVAEIASGGVSLLDSCGLHRAARALKDATTSN
jgi:hypothetical protein